MKLRVLIGVLVCLIVVNVATIGTFLFVYFTRSPSGMAEFVMPGLRARAPGVAKERFHAKERDELMGLLRDFRLETRELRGRVSDLEAEAFELMQRDPVPAAGVDSLLERIADARLEISRIAASKLIEAKTVLPPTEQRMFFNAILDARPGRPGRPGMPGARHGNRMFKRRGAGTRPDSLE